MALPRIMTATSTRLSPIPVVVCGRTTQIGDIVREVLKPEYEVTHLFLSPDTAKSEIPALLGVRGTTVTEGEKEKSPAAVILGGGYTQTDLEEIRAASQGEGAKAVAWVKVDPTKSPPSLPVGPEYGRSVAKRTKDRLDELVRSGKMNRDEVHLI